MYSSFLYIFRFLVLVAEQPFGYTFYLCRIKLLFTRAVNLLFKASSCTSFPPASLFHAKSVAWTNRVISPGFIM
jgi:hypothetical protein